MAPYLTSQFTDSNATLENPSIPRIAFRRLVFISLAVSLSLKRGTGNRKIGESGNREIGKSGKKRIGESGNGEWGMRMGNGKWRTGNRGIGESGNRGKRESGNREMGNGNGNGKWEMENGEWEMENEERGTFKSGNL